MGESAGGGLAANLALLARDRVLSPPLAKQILIYPMLDDRTATDNTNGLAFFDVSDCITGWAAYLGKDVVGTDRVPKYAAAARNLDVRGLPVLYLDCPQLDILPRSSTCTQAYRMGLQAWLPGPLSPSAPSKIVSAPC
jgi:acetyl esterase/lipase